MATTSRFDSRPGRPSISETSTLHDRDTTQIRSGFLSSSGVTPYLGLRSRLSQVWINRWTILLFLVLARTLIAVASLHDGLGRAQDQALSACTGVENVGSAMASAPHYMAAGVNALTAHGVEKAISGLMSMLLLTVTGVEELVVFVIHVLTNTYLCLITLAVSGSLHIALDLVEDVASFLNRTIGDIGKDFATGINDFDSTLNKAVSGLNDIGSAFGAKHSIPTLDLSKQVDELNNVHLPTDLNADLQKLNNSIPTFAEVQNFTDSVIRFPFEEIKKLINESLPDYRFNHTMFPVPEKDRLTFCTDDSNISKFFQHLFELEVTARRIAIAVLVILAVLVCIPMAYREIRRYRFQQERAEIIGTNVYEPMDVVYICSRPYTSSAGIWLSSKVRSARLQTLIRWVVAYATTPPALVVLSLGLAGLLSCLCQYAVLSVVKREVPVLADEIANFTDKVVRSLENASTRWANGSNTMILDTNSKINKDVFGWVNISTQALNDTLNTFTNETIKVLNGTFGGTILYEPILEVYNCLIGLKIAGIEKGLTWIHDNAHIDFPLLPNDTFSKGASQSLSDDPSSNSMLSVDANNGTDAVTGALVRLVDKIMEGIRDEALIAGALILIYLIVVLLGTIRAVTLLFGKDKVVGESGKTFVNGGLPPSQYYSGNEKGGATLGSVVHKKRVTQDMMPGAYENPRRDPFSDPRTNAANTYKGVPYTLQPSQFQPGQMQRAQTANAALDGAQIKYAGARDMSDATRPPSNRVSHYPEIATGRSPTDEPVSPVQRVNRTKMFERMGFK